MKSNGNRGESVTSIDIGSSKIAIAHGRVESGRIDLIELAVVPASGIRQGVVSDRDRAVQSIKAAIASLTGANPDEPLAGIMTFSGAHVHTKASRGMTIVREEFVAQSDIDRALEAAKAAPLSTDDAVIEDMVQHYAIDGNEGILRPIGLVARRVDVEIQRLLCQRTSMANLMIAVKVAGFEVDGVVPQAIAASHAVLTEKEMEEGVCLIDIGAANTDVAVFVHGTLHHLSTLPVGGNDISADLANAFHVAYSEAELLKVKHGVALAAMCKHQLVSGAPHIVLKELAKVIQQRFERLLYAVHESLIESGCWQSLGHGLVLTGGSANMPGLVELCEEIFRMLARVGTPWRMGRGHDQAHCPEHAAVIGALLGGFRVPPVPRRDH